MISRRSLTVSFILALFLVGGLVVLAGADSPLTPEEELGKSIFFDENLSINNNQSCASCHDPEVGFSGPDSDINAHGAVYEGSVPGEFGNRRPPTAAYATQSPILFNDKGTWTGGNFWDGRATGEKLENPAADQAQGPFINPVEQALPNSDEVVHRVCTSSYANLFKQVWGPEICVSGNEDMAFDSVALSIAAYEASPEVNAFSSKYDQTFDGKVKLNKLEQKGYALFRGKGMCHRCHISNGKEALFTDYTFDNLGVPKNPGNPVYDVDPNFVDYGLGGFLRDPAENGKQKVPTLRNVDLRPDDGFVKAYMHNGYFKSLKDVVHFYNTRDAKPRCESMGIFDATAATAIANDCWPEPEVAENVNVDELGDLGLTEEEEWAIVAFMETLSDGYLP